MNSQEMMDEVQKFAEWLDEQNASPMNPVEKETLLLYLRWKNQSEVRAYLHEHPRLSPSRD